MRPYPKVSILVPIYGTEKYIGRCCRSLFVQDYPNIEYIFVNDCTKDNAITILNTILSSYPEKMKNTKIVNHETNLGLGEARLSGLNQASGDYVWFIDSDDYISEDAFNVIKPYLLEDYDLITVSYIEEYHNKTINRSIENFKIPDLLTDKVTPSIWKNIIKKSILFDYNILPIRGINYAEDLHLLYRLALITKNRIALPNNFLYHYNAGNESSMMHNISKKYLLNLLDALDVVVAFYDKRNTIKEYSTLLAFHYADSYLKLSGLIPKDFKETILHKIRNLDVFFYLLVQLPISPKKIETIAYFYRNKIYIKSCK